MTKLVVQTSDLGDQREKVMLRPELIPRRKLAVQLVGPDAPKRSKLKKHVSPRTKLAESVANVKKRQTTLVERRSGKLGELKDVLRARQTKNATRPRPMQLGSLSAQSVAVFARKPPLPLPPKKQMPSHGGPAEMTDTGPAGVATPKKKRRAVDGMRPVALPGPSKKRGRLVVAVHLQMSTSTRQSPRTTRSARLGRIPVLHPGSRSTLTLVHLPRTILALTLRHLPTTTMPVVRAGLAVVRRMKMAVPKWTTIRGVVGRVVRSVIAAVESQTAVVKSHAMSLWTLLPVAVGGRS